MEVCYIVASCKSWHKSGFERIRKEHSGHWVYVDSPSALASVIEHEQPKYIFFLHWNWLVPQLIWEKHECICFHMTDVPYGRGGSPLQNLILDKKTETVVSALRMIGEMDAGPVYLKRRMSLEGRAEEIYLRAGEISWEMINQIVKSPPVPTPQTGEIVQFKRRKPQQSQLPKNGTLHDLYDFIRMLDAPSYPLAFLTFGDFRIEFSNVIQQGETLQAKVTITATQPNETDG